MDYNDAVGQDNNENDGRNNETNPPFNTQIE
jgi:hypothetical protein